MFFLLRFHMKNKEELSYKLTEGVKEDSLILCRAQGGLSAGQWQIEGSKFKVSLFTVRLREKEMLENPWGLH